MNDEQRDQLAQTLKRTEVQRVGSSIPGREIVQVLTEIPVGVSSGWHHHPGEEVGYIVGGTVRMEIRDASDIAARPWYRSPVIMGSGVLVLNAALYVAVYAF